MQKLIDEKDLMAIRAGLNDIKQMKEGYSADSGEYFLTYDGNKFTGCSIDTLKSKMILKQSEVNDTIWMASKNTDLIFSTKNTPIVTGTQSKAFCGFQTEISPKMLTNVEGNLFWCRKKHDQIIAVTNKFVYAFRIIDAGEIKQVLKVDLLELFKDQFQFVLKTYLDIKDIMGYSDYYLILTSFGVFSLKNNKLELKTSEVSANYIDKCGEFFILLNGRDSVSSIALYDIESGHRIEMWNSLRKFEEQIPVFYDINNDRLLVIGKTINGNFTNKALHLWELNSNGALSCLDNQIFPNPEDSFSGYNITGCKLTNKSAFIYGTIRDQLFVWQYNLYNMAIAPIVKTYPIQFTAGDKIKVVNDDTFIIYNENRIGLIRDGKLINNIKLPNNITALIPNDNGEVVAFDDLGNSMVITFPKLTDNRSFIIDLSSAKKYNSVEMLIKADYVETGYKVGIFDKKSMQSIIPNDYILVDDNTIYIKYYNTNNLELMMNLDIMEGKIVHDIIVKYDNIYYK